MATVYLAHDLKHDRDVAIKVLHPDLSAALGGDRFLSEIRTTARLQHPHILPLLDSGDAGNGVLYYVMPLASGETLRDRLSREKQLPIADALRISQEVADALGHAHQHGIIHRDIKPENILLQGQHAVVADFGIALAVQQASGSRMTQTGLSLGTPQYMSPEQAMGERSIDARSDLYALGAVTYEMLVGDPPFTGSTVQAIVARVLTERPMHPTSVRDTIPRHVERTVLKALAKLPADRQGSAAEFIAGLSGSLTDTTTAPDADGPAVTFRAVTAPATLTRLLALATVVALAATAVATWSLTRETPPANTATLTVALPDSMSATAPGGFGRLALSRDGKLLAYIGTAGTRSVVFIRSLDDTVPRRVRGTEGAIGGLIFSPDGTGIVFTENLRSWRVATTGGTPSAVVDSGTVSDWGTNEEILLTHRRGLWRFAGGRDAVPLAVPDSGSRQVYGGARFLPGNKAAVFTIVDAGGTFGSEAAVVSIPDGKVTPLGIEGRVVRYASGHLLVVRGGALFAIPFSPSRSRATGPAVQLFEQVQQGNQGVNLTVSDEGTLVYFSGSFGAPSRLVAVNRRGDERTLFAQPRLFSWPRMSPDGRHIAVEIGTGPTFDVWLINVADGALSRLTSNFSGVRPMGWSPDGRHVLYLSMKGGGTGAPRRDVARVPWDLSGPPELLPIASRDGVEDASLDAAGGRIAFRVLGYGVPGDLMLAPVDSPRVARPFVATDADEETPRFSPDGKLLAYASSETGEFEVYVRPVEGGGRLQISSGGGSEPVWSRDGRGLYYRGPRHLMYAALSGPGEVARRDTLFVDVYRKELRAVQYDVLPGDQGFLMLKLEASSRPNPIMVLNWPELVRRRSATPR